LPDTTLARIEAVQRFGNLAAHKNMIEADTNDARHAVELMESVKTWFNRLPPTIEKPSNHDEVRRKECMNPAFNKRYGYA
jgi:hypothetical protein